MIYSINVSIVICCYNSASKIKSTLKHLANQELGSLMVEVILVDNNCTDATTTIAKQVWNEYGEPYQLNIIKEEKPGLSHARKAGVVKAKGEILIFCDDDNWLDTNYVQAAYEIISNDNTIGVVGGDGTAVADIEFPDWWSEYSSGYAVGKQGAESGYADKRMYLWGAAMVTRTDLFKKAFTTKFPSLLTDRKGNELSSGGDSEYCARVLMMGYRLYYSSQLQFKHYIEERRLTTDYRDNMFQGLYKAVDTLNIYWEVIRTPVEKKFLNKLNNLVRVILIKSNTSTGGTVEKQIELRKLIIKNCFTFFKFQDEDLQKIIRFRKYASEL